MATHRIAVIAGDGIGPEVIEQAIRVADFAIRGQRTEDRGQRTEDRGQRTEDRGQRTEDSGSGSSLSSVLCPLSSTLEWNRLPWSSAYYKQHGRILPTDGWDVLAKHDAILFGAIGSPDVPDKVTVHELLLPMRRKFDEYVNLRPAYLFPGVNGPLRDKAPGSIDMLVYRENTEGEYAPIGGRLYEGTANEVAVQSATFTRRGCERIARAAFEAARQRPRKQLTSITKSNALVYGTMV